MASPRRILSIVNQVSPRTLQLRLPKSLSSPKLSQRVTLNVDTPNRSKIISQGLSNRKFKVIGVGGFGTVYRASYKGAQVAAKILKHNFNDVISAEMHRVNLKHKNIVRIIGCDQGESLSIIMMELCGPSLEKLIEERSIPKQERILFLYNVSQALKYCHKANIVHADVKPKNIYITEKGEAKLGDFGSSVFVNQIDKGKCSIRGTAGYAAPEIIRGEVPIAASDVYSLGIVAWQMLSRTKPFAGYHCHTILYLTGNGYKPEEIHIYDDEFKGEYKKLYRKMWSTKYENRASLDYVLQKLNEFKEVN